MMGHGAATQLEPGPGSSGGGGRGVISAPTAGHGAPLGRTAKLIAPHMCTAGRPCHFGGAQEHSQSQTPQPLALGASKPDSPVTGAALLPGPGSRCV